MVQTRIQVELKCREKCNLSECLNGSKTTLWNDQPSIHSKKEVLFIRDKNENWILVFHLEDMLVSKVALSKPQNYPSVQWLIALYCDHYIINSSDNILHQTLTIPNKITLLLWKTGNQFWNGCLKHNKVLVKIQRKLWLSVQKKRLLNVWALLCVLHHIAHPHISLQSPHCNYGVFVSSIVNEYREFNKTKIISEDRWAEESK